MKRFKPAKKTAVLILAALMLLSFGCETVSETVTTAGIEKESTAKVTEALTEEETEPPETEEPIVMVKISDKLEMPRVDRVTEVEYITANLNNILKNGYGAKSLMADAFSSVLNKTVIFRSGRDYDYAYVLGEKTKLGCYVLSAENGSFIALHTIEQIFGGEYSSSNEGDTLVSTLRFGENTVVCTGKEATLTTPDGEETIEARTAQRLLDDSDEYVSFHYINVKYAAKLIGLNVYYTDTGVTAFSCGQVFDSERGYYVLEEAEKLFMEEDKIEKYSVNMFVDIPNFIKLAENNVTAYTFPELDLNANVASYALQGVTAGVDLGPTIVAGQGEDDDNYTVVRVFDIYQTCHTQFNAYPASVKGGVQVAAAVTGSSFNILTAPFKSADVKTLKVYDANGSYKFSVTPSSEAPYAIAAGAFLSGDDCFAVMSMYSSGEKTVEFYSAENGEKLGSAELKISTADRAFLTANRTGEAFEGLIIYTAGKKTLAYEYKNGKLSEIELDGGSYNGVYSSAFGGYAASSDAEDEYKAFSNVTEFKDGAKTTVNAGVRENNFYSTMASKNTEYIKKGVFWHTRLEYGTAAMMRLSASKTTTIRTADIDLFTAHVGGEEKSKYKTQYNMWEPCGTHRWGKTQTMGYLIDYIDPDTGTYAYATLTKRGKRSDYEELGASFYNGSYAPYIPALDRLNYWTRRTYLYELAQLYRDAPEYTVAVSPVHEHEIDSGANSVGDYNPSMIKGFADWLEHMYGTIENVNKRFNTSFASFADLDAPRGTKRGDWDLYSTRKKANDYFTVWSLYNRYIVSQRVIEAYREALLAGFPPELIKAHQIPEGDAVAGLLGEADTRLSPVDIVLECGTGYGGTRYGVWYESKRSFFALAANSGQHNITLGEYSSMTTDKNAAYNQLKYMFDNGIVFTHVMYWEGNVENGAIMDANEKYAIDTLQANEYPRSASSGGTGDIRAYVNGETKYNIVEIGSKEESAGLLKSVNEDGSFEGTVYLQPFHAAVGATDIARSVTASGTGTLSYDITGKINAAGKTVAGLNYNDTVDIRIFAKPSSKRGSIVIKVYQDGYEIPCVEYKFTVEGEETEYRYVFKNQVYMPDCRIEIEYNNTEITDASVTFMYEMAARKYYGETDPRAHRGGVSFDLLYRPEAK